MKIPLEIKTKNLIHIVLGHAYLFYLVMFAVGIMLDILLKTKVTVPKHELVGFVVIVLGTLLMYWAQRSSLRSKKLRREESVSIQSFLYGPYAFMHSPTQVGLFLMIIGFGLLNESLYIILAGIVGLFLNRFIFVRQQDKILEAKYGDAFREYKEKVKF